MYLAHTGELYTFSLTSLILPDFKVCKQLYALTDLGPEDWVDLNKMREAMGIMQHHDAVTGTERQKVASDYARILYEGFEECGIIAETAIK
jgi:lysosomal alpha-mannosidase